MIIISQNVYSLIDNYINYLIKEGITSQERAFEKKILKSILGGILLHRPSPYKELGQDGGCLLYVYKDTKSKTQWGFAYKRFDDDNVIVYHMKNLKLIKVSNNFLNVEGLKFN